MKLANRIAAACSCALLVALSAAAPARAALVYALTDENDLLSFDSAAPEDLLGNSVISGLASNEDLVGIDFRPANNLLYGVGSFGNIYTINPANGLASYISTVSTPLAGSRFGVDFNPVADRLRIVSDLDQNLAVNVDTGVAVVDGSLSYGGSPNPGVTAAAYANSVNPAPGSTTLYAIDVRSSGDQLVIVNPPNSGTLAAVGPLGVNVGALNGFDILTVNSVDYGFAALQPTSSGISLFYSINLGTGAATYIGEIGGGDLIDGIALAPIPEPASFVLAASALLAGLVVRRRRG
jgi:hypothetical protein